jgi:transposase
MIVSFSNRFRYFLYSGACDMRKGFDGLSGLVRDHLKCNPLSGDVFIFLSRKRNRIKLLHWQTDGFCIITKRLEKGTFEVVRENSSRIAIEITPHQLQFILDGIVLSSVKKRARYEHQIVDKNTALMRVSTRD